MRRAAFVERLSKFASAAIPKGEFKLCRSGCLVIGVKKSVPAFFRHGLSLLSFRKDRTRRRLRLRSLSNCFCARVHEHLIDDRAELPPLIIFTHGRTPSFTNRRLDPKVGI